MLFVRYHQLSRSAALLSVQPPLMRAFGWVVGSPRRAWLSNHMKHATAETDCVRAFGVAVIKLTH